MSAPMVKANLREIDPKIETRRMLKPQPVLDPKMGRSKGPGMRRWKDDAGWTWSPKGKQPCWWMDDVEETEHGALDRVKFAELFCPYGKPGDRLFVRETLRRTNGIWQYSADNTDVSLPHGHPRVVEMIAWAHHKELDYCVSIHMPRFASRILLEITETRVERLHEITREGAMREGIPQTGAEAHALGLFDMTKEPGYIWDNRTSVENYAALWKEINGADSWDANPWVWVVRYRRIAALAKAA